LKGGKEYEGSYNRAEAKKYYDQAKGMGHVLAEERLSKLVQQGDGEEIKKLKTRITEVEYKLQQANEAKSKPVFSNSTSLYPGIGQLKVEPCIKEEQIPKLIPKTVSETEVMIPVRGANPIAERDLRSLMGGNFFGVDEWNKYFPGQDIGPIPEIPWNDIISLLKNPNPFLKEGSRSGQTIAESHVLALQPKTICGEQLSISKWYDIINKNQHQSSQRTVKIRDQSLFGVLNKELGKIASDSHWTLMPKEFIPKSYYKTFSEQENLMKTNYPQYETIRAVELVGGIMQHYLNTGKKLASWDFKYMTSNNNYYPHYRTSDKTKTLGIRVCVGYFDPRGLGIINFHEKPHCNLGLGVSLRKSS